MSSLLGPYGQSLSLLTDLYELTMAHGYWKSGMAEREAVFHLFFRKHPFNGGFTVACGLWTVAALIRDFRFDDSDLEYLRGVTDADGKLLFDRDFLDYLGDLEFRWDIDAAPEGSIMFPQEPLLRVRGPLLQCQILETALLNTINFQSLIATKASRVVMAAGDAPVLEFGLRRAQGIDGGLAASRAAYVGGCAATSNVLAGKLYGIPVRGTHAHSWVMSFDSEPEAFEAWAQALPDNSVFLVDTYDTIEGVRRAIEVGRSLRARGHELRGVRLDSGDLAELSRQARALLDGAGFENAEIVGSGDLDEHAIERLNAAGAAIGVWGVGTRLVTGYEEPALSGVYKLSAIRNEDGGWTDKIKVSDDIAKMTHPGIQQVRRYRLDGRFIGDVIYDERLPLEEPVQAVSLESDERRLEIPADAEGSDLLQPVFRQGLCLWEPGGLEQARAWRRSQIEAMPPGILASKPAAAYPVGVEPRLHEVKQRLVARHGLSSPASR